VVPGFTINVIFGKKDDINKIKNYNYRNFLRYIEDNSDEKQNVFGNFMTQQEFIEYMISCNMDQFIDYEKKECHFDTDYFQEFMYSGIPMSKTSFDAQKDIFKYVQEDKDTGFYYLTVVDGVEERTFIEYSKDRLACYQKTIDLIDSIDRLYQVDTTVINIISYVKWTYF